MMKYLFFVAAYVLTSCNLYAQNAYNDSITDFLKNYIEKHEVVKGDEKKLLKFYTPNEHYRVNAVFESIEDGNWFQVPTSGKLKQTYRVYGVLHFAIHDTLLKLNLYQSQSLMNIAAYKNYLFLPFTDNTNGKETYESGRYIDLTTEDIQNNQVIIDFNKAYNPYCAYISGMYNCPIPPKENQLKVYIRAGEQQYGKNQ